MTSRFRPSVRPLPPPHVFVPSLAQATRPAGVPFFRDPLHTVPTKWSLFRPLLKGSTAHPAIRRETRSSWREKKGLTSVPRVRVFLEEQYALLSKMIAPGTRSLERFECHLAEKHQRLDKMALLAAEQEQQNLHARPPRLTGAYHRPTLFNPPLPRLKPQPISISMMIHNRLRARERRMERRRAYASFLNDVKLETAFWREMEQAQKKGSGSDWTRGKDVRSPGGWDKIMRNEIEDMDKKFQRENRRAGMVFDKRLMGRVAKARSRKETWWKAQKTEGLSSDTG
ncbi:hypothetical protein IAR55_000962 [Kwoniella newhampshirensis]|uniref:Mitochondrial zinc maintenance protein 1, mitochondrial n=1 Tax=Kwoniella newhampshirensis TaxID=1651941 RepID=A0AAW0Z4H8_9TREE